MRKNISGFTIVELLIVIVVIGILAAITIVAYNGVQQKAKYALQTSEVDRIGKAIKLWEAENGESLGYSGAGAGGHGLGTFTAKNTGTYTSVSVEDLLRNSGYLTGDLTVNTGYMVTPCTTNDDPRWVVLATLTPAPPTSITDLVSASGCNNSTLALYTDPNGNYKRNYIKSY